MIYLGDDYINKYSDTLSYLIGRSIKEGYSYDYIQKKISYSLVISELEKSNVTMIAFSSMEKIYHDIFPDTPNDFTLDIYDIYGWMGYIYIHLFLHLKVTFEALFYIIPLKEMMNLYHLYHEMDFKHLVEYAKEKMKYSLLDVILKQKKISNQKLALKTNLSLGTINALRYGNRDILKLEAHKLLILSNVLNIKMETLLPEINLILEKSND